MNKFAQKWIAGFMTLWLSGVVFLLCCETLNARGLSMHDCPQAKALNHCKKGRGGKPPASLSADLKSEAINCCGFLPVIFDKARKVPPTEQTAAPASIPQSVPALVFVALNIRPEPDKYKPKLNPTGKIFIRNCVFRI